MIELVLEDPSRTVGEEFAIARALRRRRKADIRSYRDRYLAKHLASGLCRNCHRKPKPGLKHCALCIERAAVRRG